MNFFKKLFSKPEVENTAATNSEALPPEASNSEPTNSVSEETEIKEIITETYFKERYTLEDLNDDPSMLDGCLKMIESYFLDNTIEKRVESPINHPANLDQTMDDGFGFKIYCQAFQLDENQATFFLALAFSDFFIKEFGFKLYKDSQPEYPLRGMTLKYDKNGVLLSLYPYEYASKVLNYEAEFESLHQKIKTTLGNMPSIDDVMDKYQ